jgi:hypothetical protein
MVLFFGGLPLPIVLLIRATELYFFKQIIVRVVLYLALWPPVWLPQLLPTGVATRQSLGP